MAEREKILFRTRVNQPLTTYETRSLPPFTFHAFDAEGQDVLRREVGFVRGVLSSYTEVDQIHVREGVVYVQEVVAHYGDHSFRDSTVGSLVQRVQRLSRRPFRI